MKSWRPWRITNWFLTLLALLLALAIHFYVFLGVLRWPDNFKCFLATVVVFYVFDFLLEALMYFSKRHRKS